MGISIYYGSLLSINLLLILSAMFFLFLSIGLADPIPTTLDMRPTPAPTGPAGDSTTVYINTETDFALLLPSRQGGMSTILSSRCSLKVQLHSLV